jgi:hypothetical protein
VGIARLTVGRGADEALAWRRMTTSMPAFSNIPIGPPYALAAGIRASPGSIG